VITSPINTYQHAIDTTNVESAVINQSINQSIFIVKTS